MKYRYGYVKKVDSPRLTIKSPALRAIERQQAAIANEGTIECWFTAEDLGLSKRPCNAIYSEFANSYYPCDRCGLLVHQHKVVSLIDALAKTGVIKPRPRSWMH